jgi:hypothetical protein
MQMNGVQYHLTLLSFKRCPSVRFSTNEAFLLWNGDYGTEEKLSFKISISGSLSLFLRREGAQAREFSFHEFYVNQAYLSLPTKPCNGIVEDCI